jgi:hypothetical protein
MKLNLDTLRAEIQEHLEARGLVVFHSFPRTTADSGAGVHWDTDRHPDYREFIAAAEASGSRLVTLYAREFSAEMVEDALDQLTDAKMDREERRAIESRLREMSAYEGFTCQIELSFDHAQRVYIFDLRTEWFDDLSELLGRIEESFHDDDEDPESPLGGGYYSNN